MARKFQSQFHLSSALSGLQGNIQRFADSVSDSSIIDGILIEDVRLKTGQDNTVGHSLDRPINGYIPVRRDANSVIFDSSTKPRRPRDEFIVKCSADVTVTFWVF